MIQSNFDNYRPRAVTEIGVAEFLVCSPDRTPRGVTEPVVGMPSSSLHIHTIIHNEAEGEHGRPHTLVRGNLNPEADATEQRFDEFVSCLAKPYLKSVPLSFYLDTDAAAVWTACPVLSF